jgi:DNA-binding CsgD family transcriptional regulator
MARLSFVTRAIALAGSGDGESAAAVLADLDDLGDQAAQIFGAEVGRARAWTALARGAQPQAVLLLEESAQLAARTGEFLLEVVSRHDLARLGKAAEVADRLAELTRSVEGPMAAARAAHAAALAADEADGLVKVGESFEQIGARLLAAEAFGAAAAAAERSGANRQVAALTRWARDLLDKCPGGVSLIPLGEKTQELSAREREIASLTADGLSASQIADRLYLSVRTVETHLQRAYSKLGIRDRSDLPGVLGP